MIRITKTVKECRESINITTTFKGRKVNLHIKEYKRGRVADLVYKVTKQMNFAEEVALCGIDSLYNNKYITTSNFVLLAVAMKIDFWLLDFYLWVDSLTSERPFLIESFDDRELV